MGLIPVWWCEPKLGAILASGKRHAQAAGRIERVFTCSWSDWFHKDADGWRPEAWQLVKNCPKPRVPSY